MRLFKWIEWAVRLIAAALIGAILFAAVTRSYQNGKKRATTVTESQSKRSY